MEAISELRGIATPRSWHCVTCGNDSTSDRPGRDDVLGDCRFTIVTCGACGTSSSQPIPSRDEIDSFYAKSFDYRWYREHLWAKRKDAERRVAEIRRRWPDATFGRILDFGGGLGYQAEAFVKAGIECDTWDPYAPVAEAQAPGTYDAVVCLHVLEHSADPGMLLDSISSRLDASGHLIVAVPNRGGSGYARHGMNWVWAQPPICHVHHFTASGLTQLLERTGFSVREVVLNDRWDANGLADNRLRTLFVFLGLLWGHTPLLSRFAPFRLAIAALTSCLRFACLAVSTRFGGTGDSELMVHAVRCQS